MVLNIDLLLFFAWVKYVTAPLLHMKENRYLPMPQRMEMKYISAFST